MSVDRHEWPHDQFSSVHNACFYLLESSDECPSHCTEGAKSEATLTSE